MARSNVDPRFALWLTAILTLCVVWGYLRIRRVYLAPEGFATLEIPAGTSVTTPLLVAPTSSVLSPPVLGTSTMPPPPALNPAAMLPPPPVLGTSTMLPPPPVLGTSTMLPPPPVLGTSTISPPPPVLGTSTMLPPPPVLGTSATTTPSATMRSPPVLGTSATTTPSATMRSPPVLGTSTMPPPVRMPTATMVPSPVLGASTMPPPVRMPTATMVPPPVLQPSPSPAPALQPPSGGIGCTTHDDCNAVFGEGNNKCNASGKCECTVGSGTFCQLGPRRHPDPSDLTPEEVERFKALRDLSTFTLQDYKNWLRLWRNEFWKLDDVHAKNLARILRGDPLLPGDIPLHGNRMTQHMETVLDAAGTGERLRPARMDPPQYRALLDPSYFSPTNLEDLAQEENADIKKLYADALQGGGMTLIETSRNLATRIEKAMKAEGTKNPLYHLIGSSVPRHPQELCVKGPARDKLKEHVERQLREKGFAGASLETAMALFQDLDLLCSPELEYTLTDPKVLQYLMTMQAMSRDPNEPRTCREFTDYMNLLRKAIDGRGITLRPDQADTFARFQRAYDVPLDLARACQRISSTPAPAQR